MNPDDYKLLGKNYQLAISHSDTCFSRRYGLLPETQQVFDKGHLRLASCLVVQDINKHTLLTLRSPNLRVFPNSWVLPGGHIDPGESLEDGVIRELFEETGISLQKGVGEELYYKQRVVKMYPYFIFESSIPQYRRDGEKWKLDLSRCPNGHLIVYFYVQLEIEFEKIELKTNTDEVCGCVWVSQPDLLAVLNRDHQVGHQIILGVDKELKSKDYKL